MPLDATPNPNGNVTVRRNDRGDLEATVIGKKDVLDDLRANGEVLYMPHHATCPQGRGWKR